MTRKTWMLVALAGAFLGTAATAQDMTDDEILELLKVQKEIYQEAERRNFGATRSMAPDPGAARGVTLIPIAPEEVARDDGATVSADAPVSQPADPNKPLVHVAYQQADQINLRIAFGFDSAALEPSELPKLEQMCRVMQKADVNVFRIIGHTDAAGTEEYNRRLSILRAEEVARHLVENCGIAPDRLQTMGRGEADLFAPNAPDSDENRRVEFQALS